MDKVLLTLFDSLYPYWNNEMLQMEGISEDSLSQLVDDGLLCRRDGVYSLTAIGRTCFENAAREHYIDAKPGIILPDNVRAAKMGLFLKLLDRSHVQRWGIKEYRRYPKLDIYPCVKLGEDYEVSGDRVKWVYMECELEKQFEKNFPIRGMAGRYSAMQGDAQKVRALHLEEESHFDTFTPDILYASRYDYKYYAEFSGHPCDTFDLINTDRYAFVYDSACESEELQAISKFRRWVNFQRRSAVPGFWDIDTQEQDSVSQLIFVLENEDQARQAAANLSRFGGSLVEGAAPFEILTVSIEKMRKVKGKEETIWDLLPTVALPISQTNASEG